MSRTPAYEYWEEQADELRRTVLTRAAESAKGWIGATTTLLGLFGTVAVVAGPDAVDKVPSRAFVFDLPLRGVVVVLVLGTVVAAGYGLYRLTRVAHAIPSKVGGYGGRELAVFTRSQADSAVSDLTRGRRWALRAALIAATAGTLVLLGAAFPSEGAKSPPILLVWTDDGEIACGTLTGSDSKVGEKELAGKKVAGVLPVDACDESSDDDSSDG